MMFSTDFHHYSRRDFLKAGVAAGGGFLLGFFVPSAMRFALAGEAPKLVITPNAWLRIGADDIVTVIVNKSEMGQGVYTSLPMLVAEELEADWRKVRVESAPVDAQYNHTTFGIQVTGGSTSISTEWERLRKVGATAREMLIQAAAETWKVDKSSCRAVRGFVVHKSGKKLSYGKLAETAAKLPVPADVALKDPKQFKIIGKTTPRLDTPDKTTGKAEFGLDVRVPEMLTALVARAPVFGAKLKTLDAEEAKNTPGVKAVVQVPSGVAVIATGFWPARMGRDALEIGWDLGANAGLSTAGLRDQLAKLAQTPGKIARKQGEVEPALASAAKQITAEYELPYLAHAPMEPLNCLVHLKPDGCEIWTGTQMQTIDRMAAAQIAGFKPEQVQIHTTLLGGGFGRRANKDADFVAEATHVAKAAQAAGITNPIKVVWTREDDIKGGYYRPMWHSRLMAGLDANGQPIAWRHIIVGQSIIAGSPFEKAMIKDGIDAASIEGAADTPYPIPNLQVELHSPPLSIPVLWWRSVGHSHTAFVVESFIDELAHAAGKDPYQFRQALLAKEPRYLGVLDLASKKSDWGKPLPKGRGRGIAIHKSFGSWVAQVAEVTVSEAGQVKLDRVVCAIDCGIAINPDTVKAQMEGGIVYGLSAALHGEITFKDGRVEQNNFNDYPALRMNEMPKIEVHLVGSSAPPSGVGEPGVPPIAPALCNAIFAATGKRVRKLPIRSDELKSA
jgi:isoquinoline 1-oxidoreductase beta subunit